MHFLQVKKMLNTKEQIEGYHSPVNYIKSQAYFDNKFVQYLFNKIKDGYVPTTEEKISLYNIFVKSLSEYWALEELRYFVNGRRLHRLLCE